MQSDQGLHCPHLPKDNFSHGMAHMSQQMGEPDQMADKKKEYNGK